MAKRLWVFGLLVMSTAPIHGCGSGGRTVWITGNLVKGGAKYEIPDDQSVQMTFIAMEVEGPDGKMVPSSEPYPVELKAESGAFKVPGPDGYGIPPGKYRIAVSQTLSSEAAAKQKGRKRINRDADLLRDKFSEATSPIIREIPKSTDLVVDLDKPAGP